eukprot:XP_011675806.1 PREDICTED: uncharacterized protein LOC105443856 [Strongylocentrotus purpuratus]
MFWKRPFQFLVVTAAYSFILSLVYVTLIYKPTGVLTEPASNDHPRTMRQKLESRRTHRSNTPVLQTDSTPKSTPKSTPNSTPNSKPHLPTVKPAPPVVRRVQHEGYIDILSGEVSELKDKIQMQTTGAMATVGPQATVPDNEQTLSLQVEVHRVFQQRASIRKELLELESFDRDLTAKVMRKTLLVERNRVLHGKSTLGDKTISKLDRVIAAATVRRERVRNRKVGVEQRMKENQDGLDRLSSEMRSNCSDDGTIPQVMRSNDHGSLINPIYDYCIDQGPYSIQYVD